MRYLFLIFPLFILSACGERSWAEQFPAPWHSSAKMELVRLLIANNATGCGEFYWRARDGRDEEFGEYLVYCTRDRENWTAWLLWPGSGKVQGPSRILDDLPPPSLNK
jgi:hypothetical protein